MIANAMGPQKIVAAIGIRPSTGRNRRQHNGAEARHTRVDHRYPGRFSLAPLRFDLLDEDHRIARDHPDQREDAKDGHEPEWPLKNQQPRDDPGHRHRNNDEHEKQSTETL